MAAHFGAHLRMPAGWHFACASGMSPAAAGSARVAAVSAASEAIFKEDFMCVSRSD
ncbi:hypothetical protein [Undibacterium griseum]|uniref:Uncharacterized protein n=1 Tax=Undibacterium griseum TaxID=2762295 RepID=A0ABR6YJA4_9BURK|nr:hypothetical protein [Undibacterium griseum]MBC3883914.1 hypothetical protein [Undibacterium griseum]